MATAGTPVRLRPLPLGELLDETFKLYRRYFTVIAGLAVLVRLPNLIITLVSGSYRANPFTYLRDVLQNLNNPDALQAIQARQAQYTSSPLRSSSTSTTAFEPPRISNFGKRAASGRL